MMTEDDINVVVSWFKNNWRNYILGPDKDGVISFGHWENDFRKAMEIYNEIPLVYKVTVATLGFNMSDEYKAMTKEEYAEWAKEYLITTEDGNTIMKI